MSRSLWRALLLALAGLGAAGSAAAHSPIPGIGNFYSGALHPFVSPAHLICLLALGLSIGQSAQRGVARAKLPLLALAAALAVGLALHAAAGDPDTDRALLMLALATGAVVAAAWAPPAPLQAAFAVAVGLAVGIASGPSGVQGAAMATMLSGTGVAAALLVAYVAVMVGVAERPWLRIAVRVVGSWMAAAALLVLALSFATPRALPA